MITFLYGRSGSGKSYAVTEEIGKKLARGDDVILLCPEQEAVVAERRLTETFCGKIPTDRLEIMNFGRLPESVFRLLGGLTVKQIGDGGRRLFMQNALMQCAPFLKEYRQCVSDNTMIDRLVSVISEFKMFCVTPSDLEGAADTLLSKGSVYRRLGDKVSDLSLLMAVYDELLHAEYHDAQDVLSYLDERLAADGAAFFSGKHVYLDGFHGYTAQQYRIIRHIFAYSESVTVTLACDPQGEREWMLRKVYEMEKNLFSILRELNRSAEIRVLHGNRRAQHPALCFLSENLWHLASKEESVSQGAVSVFACETPFDEAEAVAMDICRYIQGGGRYRDITVVLRDVSRYTGILDVTFEKYGIPCYMSKRTGVVSKPLFRYLHHLFSIYIYGWKTRDVIGILKTGLFCVDRNASFLFENYVTKWNISGKLFTEEDDWNMHPKGYKEEITADDIAELAQVNRVKRVLSDTLLSFYESLYEKKNPVTVRGISTALWEHLMRIEMPAMLERRAVQEESYGDVTAASETRQLWDALVSAIDTLVSVNGDRICTAQEYLSCFDLLVGDLDIGTIPSYCDEVVVGDAALIRPDAPKTVYLMGTVDGVFPQTPAEDTLLSDYEKQVLAGLGVELSADVSAKMRDELFYFYCAATSACERVVLTYPLADLSGKSFRASIGVERILSMFPDVKQYNPNHCETIDRVLRPYPSFEIMACSKGTPLGDALADYYRAYSEVDARYRQWLDTLQQPLVVRRNRLNDETLKLLFGDTMAMTQSRLESYVMCHFAYFCGYVLKLQEQERAAFGAADIGNFVHYVLQGFMERYARTEDKSLFDNDSYLDEIVSEYLGIYMRNVCGMNENDTRSSRVRHLFSGLRRNTVLIAKNLIREFKNSDFVPADFELPIGGDDGRAVPALKITAEDGTKVRIYGKVDRVDLFEEDGKTYIRVVDYKTYVKKFSLDDVAAGINMQMLLYLFSVWKNGSSRYSGELVPAGILYMQVNPAEKTYDCLPQRETVEAGAEETLERSGLFLKDMRVLDAMEHGLGAQFIPIKLKKDGSFSNERSIVSLEEFGSLMHSVEKTVCALTMEMRRGNADAYPISKSNPDTGKDPCRYCKMKPVCRATGR